MSSLPRDVVRLLDDSDLIRAITELHGDAKSRLYGDKVRALSATEIQQLERQGNFASDWSAVQVAEQFGCERVWNNRLLGRVVLGSFTTELAELGDGVLLPAGVFDSTLRDTEIADDAVVHRVGMLSQTLVQPGAAIAMCGSVTCPAETTHGCGETLSLAIESGGREVRTYAEITVGVAELLAKNRANLPLIQSFEDFIEKYLLRVRYDRTIVAGGAIVKDTGRVTASYIGPGALVSNARQVNESCLMSTPDEPAQVRGGASVNKSILQWGAEADTMALVDGSVLCEHSHVERHGIVTSSIIGPNSAIGEGEITSSLVGPFVAAHHQSLLIAAMWPEGKGNIGYGANVGSNHTGRAPDQEIWCGEGTFFGLGVNIKFPTDFSRSPYSILASGVTCLPQRLEFPFSLINTPSTRVDGMSPSLNEIFPGWVLAQNVFMLKRNESKYQNRNKAKRDVFHFEVFRSEIMQMVHDARARLQQSDHQTFYLSHHIPGLGKNYLSEAARLTAIETYGFYLTYWALRGLLVKWKDLASEAHDGKALLTSPSEDPVWESQRRILADQHPDKDISVLLGELVGIEKRIAEEVERAKSKDDVRGQRTIEDYREAHAAAAEDIFVKENWRSYQRLADEVNALLSN